MRLTLTNAAAFAAATAGLPRPAAAAAAATARDAPAVLEAAYAPWAHAHQVWLSSDRSNASAALAYVADYAAHNISVGAYEVDSEWSTGNDNFIVDTSKFPDMAGFVSTLHSQGIHVLLWATSMIDTDSSNFQAAVNGSYVVRNAFNATALMTWWHGKGALLDYTSPAARSWWEGQMDGVLATGIDGWKVDGVDPYLIELIYPRTSSGAPLTQPTYSALYYGHFLNYTRAVNGPSCMIWCRPVDSYPIGSTGLAAFLEFGPKYALTSGWVGDQDPTFDGMKDALANLLQSGWHGYANFGSDTGGYRQGNAPRTGELLLRWAGLNAFLPLFENGGDGEHRPWAFDAPGSTAYTDTYRRLVNAHLELGPYLLTTGTGALEGGYSSITPSSPAPADYPFIIEPDTLGDYSFALGDAFHVVPVPNAGAATVNVTLPASANGWYSYWNPAEKQPGGAALPAYPVPLFDVPVAVFAKAGTLLPLAVSTPSGLVPHGSPASAAALTLVVQGLAPGGVAARTVAEWGAPGAAFKVAHVATTGALVFSGSEGYDRDVVLIVRGVTLAAEEGLQLGVRVEGVAEAGVALRRVAAPPALAPAAAAAAPALALAQWALPPRPLHALPADVIAEVAAGAAEAANTWWTRAPGAAPHAPDGELCITIAAAALQGGAAWEVTIPGVTLLP